MNENKDKEKKDKLSEMVDKFIKRANQTIEIRNRLRNPKPSARRTSKKDEKARKGHIYELVKEILETNGVGYNPKYFAYTNKLIAECEKKVVGKISAINVYELQEGYIDDNNKEKDRAILNQIARIISLNIVGREECEEKKT